MYLPTIYDSTLYLNIHERFSINYLCTSQQHDKTGSITLIILLNTRLTHLVFDLTP
jgi:hypothetical protein